MSKFYFISAESVTDEVREGVQVVYMTALLDAMYGENKWMDVPAGEWNESVKAWVEAHDAHYHSWEGPSYMHLAERNTAVMMAVIKDSKIVVIEALS
jgi:hypothetical protein